jgi:hypothetical protein
MNIDALNALNAVHQRVMAQEAQALFGRVPAALVPLLEAGLAELSHDERQAFVDAVCRAQAVLRDHAVRAAFDSGRARYLAPTTADELLNYKTHRIKLTNGEVKA